MRIPLLTSRETSERRRLEAFMDALPLHYCGWSADGIAIWSRGFPGLFNLPSIQTVRDVQDALAPSDAAALEGMIWRLNREGEPFTITVKTADGGRALRLSGARGADMDGEGRYDVLWAEDNTEAESARAESAAVIEGLTRDRRKHRAVLDRIPQAVWVTDPDNRLEWCNDAYTAVTQTAREDAIGRPAAYKALPLDKAHGNANETARSVFESGEPAHYQARVIVDGKRRMNAVSVIPDRTENLVIHIAQDVTEQDALRAELKRYISANTELMEQLSTAIAIFSADQRLEFYNPSFATLWGLEERWLNGQPVLGDILEKLRETRRLPEQADFKAYKKGWIDMFTTLLEQDQVMMHLPDGLAVRRTVAPHPMGGLMMTFEDVTSRLELESSYNTLIAVQRETLDNLAEGVAVYGSDARLKLCNPAYAGLWKLNPEDTRGEPHITVITEKKKPFFKDTQDAWDGLKERFIAHAIDRTEQRETITRGDGVVVECMSVPLPDGGVMVTYRDVTDTTRVRHALEEKNRALEEAERLKTDFLAKVSYQLRTPLNAISGFSEILNNEYFGEINDKQREYTQGILDAAERLSSLINDILDLSSIEAGYLRLDRDPVDLAAMMQSIYELSSDWAGMERLKVRYDKQGGGAGDESVLIADGKRLKQALLNIVRNAIACTPAGGTITIAYKSLADTHHITITDTGTGARRGDDADTLFQPASDAGTAENGNAAGLGMTLARNIIALHGGTLYVEAQDGKGTSVKITLPKGLS